MVAGRQRNPRVLTLFRTRLPALIRPLHLRLGVNSERISNPIDIIEIGYNLDSIENVPIAQTVLAKAVKMARTQRSRRAGHHFGKPAQGFRAWRQIRPGVIVFDVFRQFRIVRFGTEILSVSFNSIKTAVGPGNDSRQHLAFRPRES